MLLFVEKAEATPRNIEVPEIRTEDFSAAVDFLSNHKLVDPKRIGVLEICGGGGYAISAVATVSMYDLGRLVGKDLVI